MAAQGMCMRRAKNMSPVNTANNNTTRSITARTRPREAGRVWREAAGPIGLGRAQQAALCGTSRRTRMAEDRGCYLQGPRMMCTVTLGGSVGFLEWWRTERMEMRRAIRGAAAYPARSTQPATHAWHLRLWPRPRSGCQAGLV